MPRTMLAVLMLTATMLAQSPATQQAPAAEATFLLEGRVVDLRGEGVPVANVWVTTWQQPDEQLARGVTDGEGYFRIARVPQRSGLRAYATSDGMTRSPGYLSADGDPVTLVVHDAAIVRGTLRTRAGKPVANAVVRAELEARILFDTVCDAETDEQGRFELRAVPLGPVHFAAAVPGEGIAMLSQLIDGDAEVTLTPGNDATTTLRIVVRGLPPTAIAQLSASVLPYGNGRLTRLPPPFDTAVFDADGRCEWTQVPDQEYRVSPRADGFVFTPREGRGEPGKGPHELVFEATARDTNALACPAVLRDAAGEPLAGVELALRASNDRDTARATSADDGSLSFASPLGLGAKAIIYSLDDRWVLDQEKVEGMYGGWDRRFAARHECQIDPSVRLELRAIPACTVSGRVLRSDGQPAAFARVELEQQQPNRMPLWMTFAYATADRDGNFRFAGLHPEPLAVRIKTEGVLGYCASEPFDMAAPGTRVRTGELRLSPPSVIEGTVFDEQQRPAAGVRVWLRDWDFGQNTQKSGSVVEVITDRLGRYRFVGVPSGGAWLQLLVEAETRIPMQRAVEPFEVEPGQTYTHDLQLPAR